METGNKDVRVLAFDLGASSGRAILGTYQAGALRCEEIHRFENVPLEADGHLLWDFSRLVYEIHQGMEKAGNFDSIGFDTWGVDFGLLDKQGDLLSTPVHYRDARTAGMCEKVFERIPADALYRRTGNQIMAINTLFQLMAFKNEQPALLEKADRLLFMPDLLAHALCGSTACELTIASTGQMLDPNTKRWDKELLSQLGIPARLLSAPVPSGTVVGEIVNQGARAKVIAVAGHDTQCAVAALPAPGGKAAFLSSGTWSLLGTELDRPILTRESMELGFSNEIGADGKINYLKNIVGLWLIQECRRCWQEDGENLSYSELAEEAANADAFRSLIDPDAEEFVPPGDMPERIRAFCQRTGQAVPLTRGAVCRCIYESLALKYRYAIGRLEHAVGHEFTALHILGGGSNVSLLCQMTADACGVPVFAGPAEATALGNILIQLAALGEISGIAEGRALIKNTQSVVRYQPGADRGVWDRAYERFLKLIDL